MGLLYTTSILYIEIFAPHNNSTKLGLSSVLHLELRTRAQTGQVSQPQDLCLEPRLELQSLYTTSSVHVTGAQTVEYQARERACWRPFPTTIIHQPIWRTVCYSCSHMWELSRGLKAQSQKPGLLPK